MGTLKQEIKKAIDAHNDWKKELRKTIQSGKLKTPVNIIERDTECEFGKWLLTSNILVLEIPAKTYNKIVILHSGFHKLAGKIAALAVAGKKETATKMMDSGGSYANLSAKLIKALNDLDGQCLKKINTKEAKVFLMTSERHIISLCIFWKKILQRKASCLYSWD